MKISKSFTTLLFSLLVIGSISFACSNTESESTEGDTEMMMEPAVEEEAMEMPMDSLPPLDTTATTRPELENL